MQHQAKAFFRAMRGATLQGYGLIVGLISVLALSSVTIAGSEVERIFCVTADKLIGQSGECVSLGPNPEVASGQAFEVIEGSNEGVSVGVVLATDDVGISSFAIIGGDPNGHFEIYANGEITVSAAGEAAIDNDIVPLYTLVVQATDGEGNTGQASVTITVLDNVSNILSWGVNSLGHLGDGTTTGREEPVSTLGGITFAKLAVGINHTCALSSDNEAWCWGHGGNGRMGIGSMPFAVTSPMQVGGGHNFIDLSAGFTTTCAIDGANDAWCWGAASATGAGSSSDQSLPVAVSGGLKFAQITSGHYHNCGLTTGGLAYCWGPGANGRLGNGGMADAPTPVPVSGGLVFTQIAAGGNTTCGRQSTGVVYCWGGGTSGQLGNGANSDSSTPVLVSGGSSYSAVTVGGIHTCGLSGSTVRCWGSGSQGKLGNGGTSDSNVPVNVNPAASFTKIGAGNSHTCAIANTGAAWCWGSGAAGALGVGSTADSSVPVEVLAPSGTVFTDIGGGGNHAHGIH